MKVLSAETNLGSATNVGKSPVVRIYNSDSSTLTVTRKNTGGVTIGSYNLPADKVIYCQKNYTDTLEGGANLKATAIGYSEMLDIVSFGAGGGAGGWGGVTDSLLARYDFNDTNCYSGSGNAINDLSGNGYNGTKNSDHSDPSYSTTYAGSDIGNTFLFGQQQSEISFGGNFPPSSDADLSMFTWFRFTTFNSYNVMFSKQASSGWDLALMLKRSGSVYRLSFESASDIDGHGTNLFANKWYYLGFTLDGPSGDLKLYIKGFANPSPSTHSNEGRGTFDSSKPFYIGEERSFDAGGAGHMSQLQVYNKVLSASEVDQNYDLDKARYGF